VLIGGGTSKVGDPSGKDETRQLLSSEKIAQNIESMCKIFNRFLCFDNSPTGALIVNNADWLDHLEYIPFLREIGRHFTLNRMLSLDSVKLRLQREQPLTFLEFNYTILQAYDFLELNRLYGCQLQMGGSDQWGNIINGIELAKRISGAELFGLTAPLITTVSGSKMGKTEAGAIWLNSDRLSPHDYWQFWRNTDDKAAANALETACSLFGEGTGDITLSLPSISLSQQEIISGVPILRLLRLTSLAASNGEVRRLIQGGGVRLNNLQVANPDQLVTKSDINSNGLIKLSVGKKRHVVIKVQ
jgi:tyrosyl-tRNA synthetase